MENLASQQEDSPAKANAETKLLMRLVACRALPDAKRIVRDLERRHGYRWHPVGDRENNYGIINIGSDPGFALVERITNAIDAVVELSAVLQERAGDRYLPRSPREAVEKWHGVPDGRLKGIDSPTRQRLADNVMVRLWDGSKVKTPTVEIRDLGIGLTAELLPKTILGLNEGNKIDKLYLAGAFGQGGSTALAFSPEGAVIASRRQPAALDPGQEDQIAVAFARYSDLDPSRNKNGRYEYLRREDGTVASFPAVLLPEFLAGTAVVHFDLQIPQYAEGLTQLRGSVRWLLENALFDPVLPLWVEDRRRRYSKKSQHRQTLAGNHSRLNNNERVEHASSVEVVLDHQEARSVVWVHYWVVREDEDGKRKRPIDVYVDPYRPVAYTYFGQTHGTDDQRFVADRIRFPYLTKFLILQVELDGLAPRARRDLLSTTRDRLKQSALYEEMRDKIATALAADPELAKLNQLRKETLLSRHSDAERQKMRQRFARLMTRHRAGTDARVGGRGTLESGRAVAMDALSSPLTPLPVGLEPTFLRIANRQSPIPVRKNRSALVLLESDAPDGFLTSSGGARLLLETEPEGRLTRSSSSDFRGGRSRVLVQPHRDALAGERGKLTIYLVTPRAETLTAVAPFIIMPPEERATSGSKGRSQVQAPDPIPVHRNEWAGLDWDASSVAEVRQGNEQTEILVNVDNRHLRRLLDSAGYKEAGYRRVSNSYLLYVAFYAWLQHRQLQADGPRLEGEAFESYRQSELDRAAQTIIHSLSAEGRMED